jgi:hypothetical protein
MLPYNLPSCSPDYKYFYARGDAKPSEGTSITSAGSEPVGSAMGHSLPTSAVRNQLCYKPSKFWPEGQVFFHSWNYG